MTEEDVKAEAAAMRLYAQFGVNCAGSPGAAIAGIRARALEEEAARCRQPKGRAIQ